MEALWPQIGFGRPGGVRVHLTATDSLYVMLRAGASDKSSVGFFHLAGPFGYIYLGNRTFTPTNKEDDSIIDSKSPLRAIPRQRPAVRGAANIGPRTHGKAGAAPRLMTSPGNKSPRSSSPWGGASTRAGINSRRHHSSPGKRCGGRTLLDHAPLCLMLMRRNRQAA